MTGAIDQMGHILAVGAVVIFFDILINNTDRKGGHILFDHQDKIWLIDHGIDGGRLTAEGFGETRPVADNETAERLVIRGLGHRANLEGLPVDAQLHRGPRPVGHQ